MLAELTNDFVNLIPVVVLYLVAPLFVIQPDRNYRMVGYALTVTLQLLTLIYAYEVGKFKQFGLPCIWLTLVYGYGLYLHRLQVPKEFRQTLKEIQREDIEQASRHRK